MKSTVLLFFSFSMMLLFNASMVFGQTTGLEKCNVVWESPSINSSGSMPLGNGDIGMNVWVEENGDLLFFISKTDAWSDAGRLLKLGQVRIRLTPSLAIRPFRQELQINKGQMIIRSGQEGSVIKLRVWVDANHPVIHIEGESQIDIVATVGLNVWRNQDRDVQHDNSASGVIRGGVPIVEKADVIVPAKDNRITWYHRNELSVYLMTMKLQGLESLINTVPDQLINRTFGGCISGDGFVSTESGNASQALKTAHPTRRINLTIHVLTAQTDTPDQWMKKLNDIITIEKSRSGSKVWAEHCNWWENFWNRSWIYVQTPEDKTQASATELAARLTEREDLQLLGKKGLHGGTHILPAVSAEPAGIVLTRGYALQRFISAAGGRGDYPVKFNGSIFTVNTFKPEDLTDADYRTHGPNYWWQNTRLIYWPMLRNGDYDLMKPLFRMYLAMVPMAKERTKIYYQHEGIFFPETLTPWGTYSNDDYGWNRENQPIGLLLNNYIRYYWSGGLELTAMMLDYYDATQNPAFLRDTLLPIATGIVTFFDHHWKRDANGKIRFDPACSLESCHLAANPMPEIAGLNYILPRLLALPVNETSTATREAWTKTLADLPPLPMTGGEGQKVLAVAETFKNRQGDELPELYAVFPYRLFAIGSHDFDIGLRSVEKYIPPQPNRVYPLEGLVGGWRQNSIQVAFAGKADQAAKMVVSNFASHHSGSRFPAFWGPNQDWVPDQDHGGTSMLTLQSMVIQSEGKKIYLFPAWPKTWDLNFKLYASYNTTVEGVLRNGNLISLKVSPKSRAADIVNMLNK